MKIIVAFAIVFLVLTNSTEAQRDPLKEKSTRANAEVRESYIQFATFEAANQRVKRSFSIPLDPEQLKACFDLSDTAPTKAIPSDTASKMEWLGNTIRQPRTIFGGLFSGFEIRGGTNGNVAEIALPALTPRIHVESLVPMVNSGDSLSTEVYQFRQPHVDAAIAWIRKVTEAHEKIALDLRLEAVTPFLLKDEIVSTIARFGSINEFTPPTKFFPPVHFTVYCQPELDGDLKKPIIQRIVVVSSPSPLSVKAIRKKLGPPAVLIDDAGTRTIEVLEPSMIGDFALAKQFLAHDQETEPTASRYLTNLGVGTEAEINTLQVAMHEKWRSFLTQRSKLDIDANDLQFANPTESIRFLFESLAEGSRTQSDYRTEKKIDAQQKKSLIKRVLQDRFYQSLSRFFGGTSLPAEELLELQTQMLWITQELPMEVVSAMFSRMLDNRVVLAIAGDGVYFLQTTKAAMLAKELLDGCGLSLDPIAKNPKSGPNGSRKAAESQYSEEAVQEREKTKMIEMAVQMIDDFDPRQLKPKLPEPPIDPAAYSGRRLSAASIAIEMLDTPRTTGEIVAHGSLVTAIYAIGAEDEQMLRWQSITDVETAKRLIKIAKNSKAYKNNQLEIARFELDRNSPTFRQSKVYQDYLVAKAKWDADNVLIQADWDSKMVTWKSTLDKRRSAAKKYIRSLADHDQLFDALKKSENRKETKKRLEAIVAGTEGTLEPLCIIPSLLDIQIAREKWIR